MSQIQIEKDVEAKTSGKEAGMRMQEDLSPEHAIIRECHNYLPEELRLAIQLVDGIVAGGFVRDALARRMCTAMINTSESGLDIFLRQHMSLPQLCGLLLGHQLSYISEWPGCSGRLVSTCIHPHIMVQFIMPTPGVIITAKDILEGFDFTMNQVGYEINDSGFQYYLGGLSAIVRGELVPVSPILQNERMQEKVRKFISRGWEPDEHIQKFAKEVLMLEGPGSWR